MATFSTRILSASTDGRGIAIAATATPGTLLHTATAVVGEQDEVYLWVDNTTLGALTLTVEFGGVTTADHLVSALSIPPNSQSILICEGMLLQNGLVVRAFASAAGLNIFGRVHRIVP